MEDKRHLSKVEYKPDIQGTAHIKDFIPGIIINGVLPILIWSILKQAIGLSDFIALVATGIPSIISILIGIIRHKHIDFLAGFALFAIVGSLLLSTLSGYGKLYLLRDLLLTAPIGLIIIASLPLSRPFMYYIVRYLMAAHDGKRLAYFKIQWQCSPDVRSKVYLYSFIWGPGLLLEAGVRVYLLFTLDITHFLAISPIVSYSFYGFLIFLCVIVRKMGISIIKKKRSR
ncbi:hypothetical protein EPA93_16495 [Ktedonosporobacter rubrisoli]|uniref:DUF3159 domain-containing protein n=1 Tax=Ktedonosporobacter rubrisoli TaxID=2509675 RepID=A0A4P6JQG7_KTERU|nr:VC0807 family protein [Ktedonosporobacter rubrisoli]QBD77503.1 hypothetical protein EPA93_16495 [Ktedonosporobacter rubrisoli]